MIGKSAEERVQELEEALREVKELIQHAPGPHGSAAQLGKIEVVVNKALAGHIEQRAVGDVGHVEGRPILIPRMLATSRRGLAVMWRMNALAKC